MSKTHAPAKRPEPTKRPTAPEPVSKAPKETAEEKTARGEAMQNFYK